MLFFLFRRKGVLLLTFLLCICTVRSSFATFLGGEDVGSGARAGRPRFGRKKQGVKYVGVGIGMNPYDHISNIKGLALGADYMAVLETPGLVASNTDFVGFAYISFGFVPSKVTWLRNNIELSIKYTPVNVNTQNYSNGITIPAGGTDYQVLDLFLLSNRLVYELYFQYVPKGSLFSFFTGGGVGIANNMTVLNGIPCGNGTGSSTQCQSESSGTLPNELFITQNLATFSMTYQVTAGMTIDITQGFAAEIKGRYFWVTMPFGYSDTAFTPYRTGFELVFAVLLKI